MKEKAVCATGHSSLYGFLSTLFREEITMNQLNQLKTRAFIIEIDEIKQFISSAQKIETNMG